MQGRAGMVLRTNLAGADLGPYAYLRQEGLAVLAKEEAEAVFELANCRSPGRPHVARALVDAGLVSSLDEAFHRFLKKNRPAWVPKFKMSASHAIDLIHEAGGVAVMAHPGLNRTDEVIPGMVDAGLDGIECFHTKHSTATSEHYLELADRFHLLITGGSDCHGYSKGKPVMGSVRLPYQHVERLKARAAPGLVTQVRPIRPRPRVCWLETTSAKSGAPASAQAIASSLVEPIESK